VAFVWGHARMGVLQAAAAWIRQYIGIKKKGSRGTERRDGNGGGDGGKEREEGRA